MSFADDVHEVEGLPDCAAIEAPPFAVVELRKRDGVIEAKTFQLGRVLVSGGWRTVGGALENAGRTISEARHG